MGAERPWSEEGESLGVKQRIGGRERTQAGSFAHTRPTRKPPQGNSHPSEPRTSRALVQPTGALAFTSLTTTACRSFAAAIFPAPNETSPPWPPSSAAPQQEGEPFVIRERVGQPERSRHGCLHTSVSSLSSSTTPARSATSKPSQERTRCIVPAPRGSLISSCLIR
ncbi:uncharacterized protein LAESUDRAFT_765152 [Laetiporus sulphureus 93-53]|uniref:Uncharacterized protein n=1 Tax=Laetiporus sulphureus 93-53 TaxID=1314785 RepID=A0A165AXI3_9APHY|nr:uncharacterized protein LAESUDRAFT_765152 [Laetiporus sulphureus 93-53]KZS99845.1 hypothetical protein LAESUDRAFT_765152 [Laetiporus sulphureus 93-53]